MDTLATLRILLERENYKRAEAEAWRVNHPPVPPAPNVHTKFVIALDRAIAIITEADALLPVFQQMAHSVALGDAGDGALKRLIGLLYSEGVQHLDDPR